VTFGRFSNASKISCAAQSNSMKKGNRKLRAAWGLTILTTIMLGAPTLATSVSAMVGVNFAWVLIGEATWAAIISLLWTAYFGANVAEKHTSMIPDHQYNKDFDNKTPIALEIEEEPVDGDFL